MQPPRLWRRCTCVLPLFLISTQQVSATPWKYGFESSIPKPQGQSHGAVASESTICSQIGTDLIRHGGNAADAMVGTTLCVGVIGMYHSGIGGGGFMLVRDPDGNYETIDYRETAPSAGHENMYQGNVNGSIWGGLAVGVPGELRGLEYLHQNYGSLPWQSVVTPAVRVARLGFPVTEDLVRYMDFAMQMMGTFLIDEPVWAEDFAPNGTLVKLGDIITRKRYADTLEKIGRYGVDIFYEGEIAESMVELIQKTNGTLTLDDFKNYEVIAKPATSIKFRDFNVFSTGAPTSGTPCLMTLKIMEQFPRDDIHDTNLTTHRFIEALRFAYGARSDLGDPDFLHNLDAYEEKLLSDSKAKDIASRILDNATQPVENYDPSGFAASPGHGTSHIVTADASGMAISSTTTVNLLFGSLLMTADSGIILNNEMNDFSIPGVTNEFRIPPAPANYIRAGKRPLSSITPVIAEYPNGTLVLVTGAAGGSRILSATAQVAWRVLELGEGLADALAAPRLHDQLIPNQVAFEYTFDNFTVASMEERGHNATWVRLGYSAVQGLMRAWDGSFEAAGEPRQLNSGGLTT